MHFLILKLSGNFCGVLTVTFAVFFSYSTDNAAMVAVAGYFKYLKGEFASQDLVPYARQSLKE